MSESLEDYTGTILVVSHDRNFLDCVVNNIYEVKKDGAELFKGDYNSYLNPVSYTHLGLSFQKSYEIGDRRYHGYGGGIGWDTFLGPISLMLSNDLDSSSPLFEVYMGYTF